MKILVVLLVFLLPGIALAQLADETMAWSPSAGAVKFRLYFEDCKWNLATETTEARVVTQRTCSWKLYGESTTPSFTVKPPFTRAHWMAVDVLADGTEVRQAKKGWWTQP